MPYDWDEEQRREAAQQEAVDAAVSAVNLAAVSAVDRRGVVVDLLAVVHGNGRPPSGIATAAVRPIEAFTDDPAERRFLTMRACGRLFDGMRSAVEAEWLRETFLRRDAEDVVPGP